MNRDITYSSDRKVDLDAFRSILERSALSERRPVEEPRRLAGMLDAYNLIVTAWSGDLLVGISTVMTDGVFVAYLADLAVDREFQGAGIGTRLVELTRELVGPEVTVLLLSAPGAETFYERIGMERFPQCFIIRRSR